MGIALVVFSFLLGVSLLFNWHLVRELRFYAERAESAEQHVFGGSVQHEKFPGIEMPKPNPPNMVVA